MVTGLVALWLHWLHGFAFFVFDFISAPFAQTKRLHLPAVDTVSLFVYMVIGAKVATPFSLLYPIFFTDYILPEYFSR